MNWEKRCLSINSVSNGHTRYLRMVGSCRGSHVVGVITEACSRNRTRTRIRAWRPSLASSITFFPFEPKTVCVLANYPQLNRHNHAVIGYVCSICFPRGPATEDCMCANCVWLLVPELPLGHPKLAKLVMAWLLTGFQQARQYATETSSKGGSNAFFYAAGGAAIAGAGYYYLGGSTPVAAKVKDAVPAKPAFTGGDQGFLSLKLADVDIVNHNTKRLRFELPESDMVSGLHIASAILTKFKGPNDEKATLRPYTPISDEGTTEMPHLLPTWQS